MSLFKLLSGNAYLVVNKHLARLIGLNETLILSQLIAMQEYYESTEELVDGMFFCTIERLEEETTFKKDTQNRAVKKLEQLGLIEKKMMGLPAKRYFRVKEQAIAELLETKDSQNAKPDNIKGLEDAENKKGEGNPHSYQDSQNAKPRRRKMRNLEDAKSATIIKESIIKNKLIKDDDDIYITHARENNRIDTFTECVKDIIEVTLQSEGISDDMIGEVLNELSPADIFPADIVQAALKAYRHKLDRKESVSTFGRWFIKALRTAKNEKTNQISMQAAYNKRFNIPERSNQMEFPFYNWLEEDVEA